jgi:hypothetical protein
MQSPVSEISLEPTHDYKGSFTTVLFDVELLGIAREQFLRLRIECEEPSVKLDS